MSKFVSLHNHTGFSIGYALTSVNELFAKCAELGQSAVGIADIDTMAANWDALKASKKYNVKLIMGCSFNYVEDLNSDDTRLYRLVLIAKNHIGYKNLLKLRKEAFDNGVVHFKKMHSRINWNILSKYSDGLICLSGDGNGYLSQLIMDNKLDKAVSEAKKFHELFGDNFALELQPSHLQIRSNPYSGSIDQNKINIAFKNMYYNHGIPCVVATGSMYLEKEHYASHDAILAISSGQPIFSGQRFKLDKNEYYVKSEEQVREYFSRHKNLWPQDFVDYLIDQSALLADKCEDAEWVDPKYSNPTGKELPEFDMSVQSDYQDFLTWKNSYVENHLADDCLYYRYIVFKSLDKLESLGGLVKLKQDYIDRINEEFRVIEHHGFSSYMLMVWDFVNWCSINNVVVGPGRGSVGGSMTAYLVGIHQADPFKYELIFSRFLNMEKVNFPDIDMDFSPNGRDRLHTYIRNKYGSDCVAHVSNFSTITPKVYARDIARIFEFGDDGRSAAAEIGDAIADSISDEFSRVTTALEQAPLFAEYAKQYPELAQHSILGGKIRSWATHAAGLIIGKRPLHEIVPIRKDTHGDLCLEYEKERAEEAGLVKMDTLGLETLDVISKTCELIELNGKSIPDINPNEYDQKTYDMISNGDISCVFQLAGVSAPVCKQVKPKSILDLAIITALIRPAAKEIIPDFVKVRNGEKDLHLMHPSLERALNATCGFALFEESLMFIAADVAGWNFYEADGLRKMTKNKGKYPEKVKALREKFAQDTSKKHGISIEEADNIWSFYIENFGGYGFNRSHAVLYSLITYKTAYLKAHYPLEFLVANLMSKIGSSSPKDKDEVLKIKKEIRDMGVKIVPPDINTSDLSFKIIDDKTLMTGLDALRNTKEGAIEEIRNKRPFKSLKDLISRTDSSKVRSNVIQAMAASGALDNIIDSREHAFFYCSDYRKKLKALSNSLAKKIEKDKITKDEADKIFEDFNYPFPDNEPKWKPFEMFALEEHFLGEGITGTINERFPGFFDRGSVNTLFLSQKMPYIQVEPELNRKTNQHNLDNCGCIGIKGIVTSYFEFRVKKEESPIFGQTMAKISMQDPFGNNFMLTAFPDGLQRAKDRISKELGGDEIKPGIALFFNGAFQWEDENTYSFILGDILSYKGAPKMPKNLKAKSVKIRTSSKLTKQDLKELNSSNLADLIEDELAFEGHSLNDDEFNFR